MANGERLSGEVVLKPSETCDFRVQYLGRLRRAARLMATYDDENVKAAFGKSFCTAFNDCVDAGLTPVDIKIALSGIS